MTGFEAVSAVGFGAISGLLIGCVGIGGVILTPALVYLGGVPIHTAIPAALAAYLVSGAVGTWVYWRARSIQWRLALALWLGAMPASLAGALVGGAVSASWLEAAVGFLTAASGAHALLAPVESAHADACAHSPSRLAAIGAVTGFASALTGTGGPLVLVPILLWMSFPVLTAVGLAQAIQLPIALLASAGNAILGTLDVRLAVCLGLGLAFGTWLGAKLAHSLPRSTLRRVVAGVLALAGAFILIKIAGRAWT